MSKVELPFIEPMYSTYLWMASAGVPAKQNPTSDNWYYNHTVQWKCSKKFLGNFTGLEFFFPACKIWNMPFLDISGASMRFARHCPITVIKTMLDDGFYVAFYGVDDFYIKGKSWYQERHFNHDGLIIGYDDEDDTFTVAAYNQRWIYTTFKTPQKCFTKGIESMCNQEVYGGLHAIRVKGDALKLEIDTISSQLKNYLSSIDNYSLGDSDNAEGIVVYDYICMYLDKLMDGSIPYDRHDWRIFRLIWEHKRCMGQRIIAVERECNWNNDLSSSYVKVVKLADKAKLIYAKFGIKFSARSIEQLQCLLMQMRDLELELLGEFSQLLEKELEKQKNIL